MYLVVLVLAAAVAPKPGLAVMDMKVEAGLSKGVGALLNERLITEFQNSPVFGSIMGASDMREMLDLEQQKTALGCGDSNCLAELGGALGVPYLVTSSVGRVGSRLMLNIKLLEVEEARVAARSSVIYDDEDKLVDGLTADVRKMLAKTFGKRPEPVMTSKDDSLSTTQPQVSPSTARRPFSWLGIALIGSGVGVFGAMAPSEAELVQARQSYDDSMTDAELLERGENLTRLVERFESTRTMSIGLAAIGAGLNLWSMWSAR